MKGDLHIHSKYSSDSKSEPSEIIAYAFKIGLSFIAIADHNFFKKHESDSLLIIPAEEVSSIDGHILALFIDHFIPPKKSQEETIEEIHDANGIAILAHPYRFVNGIGKKAINLYDGIEVKNSRCGKECNLKAAELSNQWNKGTSAGSDAHYVSEVGLAWIDIPSVDIESIRKSIISGLGNIGGYDLDLRRRISLYWKLGSEYVKRGFKRI